jgi:trans-2,3-dihydro-3-hydroxyanthranilate isomerase
MKKPIFYIVDVFAEEKFSGNQLAVFNYSKFSNTEMQKIAREMHYSETTFILSENNQNNTYDVRIFTPHKEIPFAGHPTLGTAYVIQKEIIKNPVNEIVLNLKSGKIPVFFPMSKKESEIIWMKQLRPIFGKELDPKLISEILNLNLSDIETRFPIQIVSTGLPTIIVPLKTLDAVKQVKINTKKLFQFVKTINAKTILVFCPETYKKENHLNARFFAEYLGIMEDPATGSANGCLAGYLVEHNYFNKDRINIRVEQGYEIGRPSQLYLKANKKDEEIDVFVGGKVIIIAKGKFI